MCGIAGILRVGGEDVPQGLIDAMVATLRHRGPDGEGHWFAPGIGLGFTRLAIIDPTPASDQPFLDDEAQLALIFNGEIYNYLELRSELKALGHRFRSDGDTEVILRAYDQWGTACLQRFNGMFSIALWDGRRRQLFLARDRFGEKPMYLARSPKGVVFASEIKAILAARPELRRANGRALYRYLSRGDLDLDEETFFAGIESLPPSHYVLLGPGQSGEPQRYWRPTSAPVPAKRSAQVARFKDLLTDSVRLRLRSDVPVGSSLSGGLDSSSIVATINDQKASQWVHQRTFSARFKSPQHDEGHYIDRLTYEVDAEPHHTWIEPDQFVAEFERLQWHQEEPMASASPYAQYKVMELAKRHGTTVLLDGQGADEVLAGYDQSQGMFWAHWLSRGRVDRLMREMAAFAMRYDIRMGSPALFMGYYLLPGTIRDRLAERYFHSATILSPELRQQFSPAHVDTLTPFPDRMRNELVRWQTATQLPEFLRYADRNSMAFGREVRLPFLDHRLVEFCFGLPPEMLLNRAITKVVLRDSMRGLVPDEILDRKDKVAYSPPQSEWLHGPLLPWVQSMLRKAEQRDGVYNPRAVLDLRERFQHGADETLTWRIASTEGWFQAMIEGPSAVAAEVGTLDW